MGDLFSCSLFHRYEFFFAPSHFCFSAAFSVCFLVFGYYTYRHPFFPIPVSP
jgi:hypothetical protein